MYYIYYMRFQKNHLKEGSKLLAENFQELNTQFWEGYSCGQLIINVSRKIIYALDAEDAGRLNNIELPFSGNFKIADSCYFEYNGYKSKRRKYLGEIEL